MKNNFKAHIFVVDDDSCICDAVCLYLKRAKYECSCFGIADDCLEQLQRHNCDLLITDVKMPGKDGLELLAEAKGMFAGLGVLVMSSYGDIPMAVRAVKAGAIDFIEKPFEWENFLAVVESAIEKNAARVLGSDKSLTKTEKTVLRLILEGKSNKEIGHTLGRSVRTIEVHRSHIMHKLEADNVVELVQKAAALGLGGSR